MIEYVEAGLVGVVAIKITKPFSQEEYHALIPEMERKIKDYGRINLYLEVGDGVRWEGKSFWSDINFNLKHAQDFRKVAFVGNEQCEEKVTELIKPIENAEIRWYNYPDKQEAIKWLKA